MRFAEPVRGIQDPQAALERLVARGEALVDEPTTEDEEVNGEQEPS